MDTNFALIPKVLSTAGVHSDVYMFSHKLSAVRAEFVSIATLGGRSLLLTPNHYLYVNGKMAVAAVVKAGDELTTGTGASDKVCDPAFVFVSICCLHVHTDRLP